MAITAGIAIFATLLRAKMGADEYIIQDVKGHATVGWDRFHTISHLG